MALGNIPCLISDSALARTVGVNVSFVFFVFFCFDF